MKASLPPMHIIQWFCYLLKMDTNHLAKTYVQYGPQEHQGDPHSTFPKLFVGTKQQPALTTRKWMLRNSYTFTAVILYYYRCVSCALTSSWGNVLPTDSWGLEFPFNPCCIGVLVKDVLFPGQHCRILYFWSWKCTHKGGSTTHS